MNAIALSPSDDIPGLSEQIIYPASTQPVNTGFLQFPVETENCRRIDHQVRTESVPRMSLFRADEAILNGFRFYEQDDKVFSDASLTTGTIEYENRSMNHKFSIGQVEDLDFRQLGAGRSAPCQDLTRDGEILLPCSDEPSNYGSWIYRFLPKLLVAREQCSFESILVYQQPWMSRIMEVLDLRAEIVSHNPRLRYAVSRPIIPSIPAPYVYLREEIRTLFSRLQASHDEHIDLGERIYVSRRGQALKSPLGRVFENETSLVAQLMAHGFQEFLPEQYSFTQQMAIFAKARIIVGCGGSNMFGTVFARNAELIVDIESSGEWAHAHANLLASSPAHWSMVQGTTLDRGSRPHFNWWLDTDGFCDGLTTLLGS